MILLMFFVYWIGTCFSILERRVIGGIDSSVKPWMVYLESPFKFCGGVLYTNSLVITAAHCNKFANEAWKAYVNATKVIPQVEGGVGFDVIKRVNHENYDSTIFGYYDISVWWIKGNSNEFTEVKLYTGIEISDRATDLKILGWGNIKKGQLFFKKIYFEKTSYPDKLKEASLPLIYDTDCKRTYPSLIPSTSNFCIGGGKNKPSPSGGDSGGPVFRVKGKNIILIGIMSFGKLYQTKYSYDVCVKISEPSVASFINHFVPFFNPNYVKNGKIGIEIPSHYYARKLHSYLPYHYSNINNDLSALQLMRSRTKAFLRRKW